MFELSRLKKRARTAAVGLAATGMVVGNVASVAALNTASMTLSDSRPRRKLYVRLGRLGYRHDNKLSANRILS